jgi:putative CocE/NonD family hydrolase
VEFGREDVLHYDGNTFSDYYPVVGRITIEIFVSSTAVDTDFTAKLIDLYPDGREMLVQDSIIRMRWRNLVSDPFATEPAEHMEPGKVYNATIDLGMMTWLFNPGHALRVSISSSNYPRFSINYNSGLFVKYGNESAVNATNTMHFGGIYPSRIILPVVSLQWLEDHTVGYDTHPINDRTNGAVTREQVVKMREKYLARQAGFE